MPIPTTFPSGLLNKIPTVPTPTITKWPVPPLQGLVPPSVNPPNPCSEHPNCDCLCHVPRKYPEHCECKVMCENFFQPITQVFGMVNAAINAVEDIAGQLDELHESVIGGIGDILIKNPILLPSINMTDDIMDTITSVTSPYTDPIQRITEIINGQGISDSCGWLSCAFKALRSALNFPTIPDIVDVGEAKVREVIQGIEDALNNGIDEANDDILKAQETVAQGVLNKFREAGLDRFGFFTEQANEAFEAIGLTQGRRDGIDGFVNCIVQSCNRTSCRYRKKFKEYIQGPQEAIKEHNLNPLDNLIGLTEDVGDFVVDITHPVEGKKLALNQMLEHGFSDVVGKVIPDPVLDCQPGHCRYCGPTCVSAHTPLALPEAETIRYQTDAAPKRSAPGPAESEETDETTADPSTDAVNYPPIVPPGRDGAPGPITVSFSTIGWSIDITVVEQVADKITIQVLGGGNEVVSASISGGALNIILKASTTVEVVGLLNGSAFPEGQQFTAIVTRAGSIGAGGDKLTINRDVNEVVVTPEPIPQYRTVELASSRIPPVWSIILTDFNPIDPKVDYPQERVRLEVIESDTAPAYERLASLAPGDVPVHRFVFNSKLMVPSVAGVVRKISEEGIFYAAKKSGNDDEILGTPDGLGYEGPLVLVEEAARTPLQIPAAGIPAPRSTDVNPLPPTAEPNPNPPEELGCASGPAYDPFGALIQVPDKIVTNFTNVSFGKSEYSSGVPPVQVLNATWAFRRVGGHITSPDITAVFQVDAAKVSPASLKIEEAETDGKLTSVIFSVNPDKVPTLEVLKSLIDSSGKWFMFYLDIKDGLSSLVPRVPYKQSASSRTSNSFISTGRLAETDPESFPPGYIPSKVIVPAETTTIN